MALAGNWAKEERYARLGQLGGYQCKGQTALGAWRQGMPKLTQAQQTALLVDYMLGMKGAAIAAKYGVATSYVSKLASRRGLPMRDSVHTRKRKARAAEERAHKPKNETPAQRMRRLRAKLEAL